MCAFATLATSAYAYKNMQARQSMAMADDSDMPPREGEQAFSEEEEDKTKTFFKKNVVDYEQVTKENFKIPQLLL